MSPWLWALVGAGAVAALIVAGFLYLSLVMVWENQRTIGLGYYGLPPAGRSGFKQALRRHARLLHPMLRLLGRISRFTFAKGSFQHRGIAGPQGTCSRASFEQADRYQPRPEDVFVVTQMKCGTTWMQHLVYEVLRRGDGEIVQSGTTLYAVSPWLEALKSVPVDQAPLVGTERPSRIIKTHLPASHCPFSPAARYIYVVRHPVSCFASCADFVAANLGAFAPDAELVEEWFCSDQLMWWGTWPAHVRGWWDRSRQQDNVLFVSFEEMKRDLPGIARRVADFLGVAPLSEAEMGRVVEKAGFAYMQRHKDAFEMHPPHILATDAEMFVRGTADRHKDVPEETRRRIARWCAAQLDGADFPLARFYPDVTATGQHPPSTGTRTRPLPPPGPGRA